MKGFFLNKNKIKKVFHLEIEARFWPLEILFMHLYPVLGFYFTNTPLILNNFQYANFQYEKHEFLFKIMLHDKSLNSYWKNNVVHF